MALGRVSDPPGWVGVTALGSPEAAEASARGTIKSVQRYSFYSTRKTSAHDLPDPADPGVHHTFSVMAGKHKRTLTARTEQILNSGYSRRRLEDRRSSPHQGDGGLSGWSSLAGSIVGDSAILILVKSISMAMLPGKG